MAKKSTKTSAAKKQSIGTTLKSLTLNFGALAKDAQLVALMELTNLYKRTKAVAGPERKPPAGKQASPVKKAAKKVVKKAAKGAKKGGRAAVKKAKKAKS